MKRLLLIAAAFALVFAMAGATNATPILGGGTTSEDSVSFICRVLDSIGQPCGGLDSLKIWVRGPSGDSIKCLKITAVGATAPWNLLMQRKNTGYAETTWVAKAKVADLVRGSGVNGWYPVEIETYRNTNGGSIARVTPTWGGFQFLGRTTGLSEMLFAGADSNNVTKIDGTAWGTHAAGMVPADLRDIGGSALSTSTAQLGVNVVNWGGTAVASAAFNTTNLAATWDVLLSGHTGGTTFGGSNQTSGGGGGLSWPGPDSVRIYSAAAAAIINNTAAAPTNFALLAVDGSGRVDVGKWLGNAVTSTTTNGKPDVVVTTNNDKSGYSATITSFGTAVLSSTNLPATLSTIPAGLTLSSGAVITTAADKAGIATAVADKDVSAYSTTGLIGTLVKYAGTAANWSTLTQITNGIWDEPQVGHAVAGSFGKYLDAQVSTIGGGSLTYAGIWSYAGGRTLTDKANFTLAAGEHTAIAGDVWNATRANYTTAGSFGQGVASVQGSVTGSTGSVASGGITTASIAAGALTNSLFASDVRVGIDWGRVSNQSTAVNLSATDTRNISGSVTIQTTDKNTFVDLVWDELQSGHTTAGTFGKFLDAQVSTIGGGGGGWASAEKDSVLTGLYRQSGALANYFGNHFGIDWNNISNKTASVALTNTTISAVTLAATQSLYAPAKAGDAMAVTGDLSATMKTSVVTAASAATPVVTLSGDFSATMKTSLVTAANAATPTVAGISGITFPAYFSQLLIQNGTGYVFGVGGGGTGNLTDVIDRLARIGYAMGLPDSGKVYRFVSKQGDNTNGRTPATAWTTLDSLKTLTTAAEVFVGPGTYPNTSCSLFAAIEIHGAGINQTIVRGDSTHRVFTVFRPNCQITDMTIEGLKQGTGELDPPPTGTGNGLWTCGIAVYGKGDNFLARDLFFTANNYKAIVTVDTLVAGDTTAAGPASPHRSPINMKILRCQFRAVQMFGIDINPVVGLVQDCRFDSISANGFIGAGCVQVFSGGKYVWITGNYFNGMEASVLVQADDHTSVVCNHYGTFLTGGARIFTSSTTTNFHVYEPELMDFPNAVAQVNAIWRGGDFNDPQNIRNPNPWTVTKTGTPDARVVSTQAFRGPTSFWSGNPSGATTVLSQDSTKFDTAGYAIAGWFRGRVGKKFIAEIGLRGSTTPVLSDTFVVAATNVWQPFTAEYSSIDTATGLASIKVLPLDTVYLDELTFTRTTASGGGLTPADLQTIPGLVWNAVQASYAIPGTFGHDLDQPISGITGLAGNGAYTVNVVAIDTSTTPDTLLNQVNIRINNRTQSARPYNATTGNDGKAAFQLDAATWVVFTTAPGYAPKLDTINVTGPMTDTLKLSHGRGGRTTVIGTLTDAIGRPYDRPRVRFELVSVHDSTLYTAGVTVPAFERITELQGTSWGTFAADIYPSGVFNDSTYYRVTVMDNKGLKLLNRFAMNVPTADTLVNYTLLKRWAIR